jgi:hypothetical protein
MTTAASPRSSSVSTGQQLRLGDRIWEAALALSAQVNRCELASSCRNQQLSRERAFGYVASMYPIVVGFNRGLIRGIAKVDHVRDSRLVKHLAEQLREEQMHNELWRRQLDAYGIDHMRLYSDVEAYFARLDVADANRFTEQTVAATREDVEQAWPGIWPDPVVPEPVLALYHLMWWTSVTPEVHYWEHFASQSAVEFMIFEVVSESVYPGFKGHPELDRGPSTMRWWQEHARQGSEGGKRSDEEKHLEMAKLALNRNELAHSMAENIERRAEDAMTLFAATAMSHNIDQPRHFDVRPYLTK